MESPLPFLGLGLSLGWQVKGFWVMLRSGRGHLVPSCHLLTHLLGCPLLNVVTSHLSRWVPLGNSVPTISFPSLILSKFLSTSPDTECECFSPVTLGPKGTHRADQNLLPSHPHGKFLLSLLSSAGCGNSVIFQDLWVLLEGDRAPGSLGMPGMIWAGAGDRSLLRGAEISHLLILLFPFPSWGTFSDSPEWQRLALTDHILFQIFCLCPKS